MGGATRFHLHILEAQTNYNPLPDTERFAYEGAQPPLGAGVLPFTPFAPV